MTADATDSPAGSCSPTHTPDDIDITALRARYRAERDKRLRSDGSTQYMLGQSLIQVRADTARAETHVLSYHRVSTLDAHGDTVIGGRYLDRLDKIDGAWRLSGRTMVYDWYQDLGAAVDWSAGLMGAPLDTGAHTGRVHGDPSQEFFGHGWSPALGGGTQ